MTTLSDTRKTPGRPGSENEPLLSVRDLVVDIAVRQGSLRAVDGVSFDVRRGEVLGIVGESGSGKSVTCLSLLRLLPGNARITAGEARFGDIDLLSARDSTLRKIRGGRISLVSQDPLTSLNPVISIGDQLSEAIRVHRASLSRAARMREAEELLRSVGIPDPGARCRAYPHELSGGMRQRVMIAMAMSNHPDLLIADEPTTALDVTTQAQVLDTLRAAREALGAAMILISHDLGVIADHASRVAVMYHGRVVDTGPTRALLNAPRHPYTIGLLESRPSMDRSVGLRPIPGQPPAPLEALPGCAFAPRCVRSRGRVDCITTAPDLRPNASPDHLSACHFSMEPTEQRAPSMRTHPPDSGGRGSHELLSVTDLVKGYPINKGVLRRSKASVHAVRGVSFEVAPGRTVALVGESGCGKSTTARTLLRLLEPTSGQIRLDGVDIAGYDDGQLRQFRTKAQIVFQDPYSSFNPRKTIGESIGEPLHIHNLVPAEAQQAKIAELLVSVGLHPEHAHRYPHELSGGQRQRAAIARAIGLEPELLVLDEPVSALDVSIQAQILNLLIELQQRRSIAFLLIAHDLAMVRYVADFVNVMYAGEIVESGPVESVLHTPRHPYTCVLLEAIPGKELRDGSKDSAVRISGDLPSPLSSIEGCPFHTRCFKAQPICQVKKPALEVAHSESDRRYACHFPESEPA